MSFASGSPSRRLPQLYLTEALAAHASNLLMLGIFFYMHQRFGWGALANLLLSSSQGCVYVVGALCSSFLSWRMGRRRLLRTLNVAMACVVAVAACWANQWVIVVVLLVYTTLCAVQWPALESLVCDGAGAEELARRTNLYNLTWALVGSLTVAASGTIIEIFPRGIFILALVAHLVCSVILRVVADVPRAAPVHSAPEPELVSLRTLAMRLSRIALPATYAALYGIGALMPTVAVIRVLSPQLRTLVGSVWMMARFPTFAFLALTCWWHTRPRALLVANAILLISFLGITLRFSDSMSVNLGVMIFSQIALGAAMALIYAASLYFGMVLSEGSTEHGGYHEALIGLGSVLGPGAGAIAQYTRPQNPAAGITAIATLLGIAVFVAAVASLIAAFSRRAPSEQSQPPDPSSPDS
jgi:MFS family permease